MKPSITIWRNLFKITRKWIIIQKITKWYLIWWWYIRCDHSRSFEKWFYHMQLDYHDGLVPFDLSNLRKMSKKSKTHYFTSILSYFWAFKINSWELISIFRSKNCLDLPHLPLRIIYFLKLSPAEIIQPIYQLSRRVWFQVPPKLLCKMGKYLKSLRILT